MKVKLSNEEMQLIDDISNLLGIGYGIKDNQISVDDCLKIIEDSKDTILYLQNELKHKGDDEEEEPDRYEDYRLGLL